LRSSRNGEGSGGGYPLKQYKERARRREEARVSAPPMNWHWEAASRIRIDLRQTTGRSARHQTN
jgi:hypothetical protein